MLSLFDALYYRYPRSVSAVLLASLGFALATWITWPLLPQFERALPSGDSPWGTVPMLNSWILWWNAAQLRYGFEQYWHAPIFAPEYGTLAFSEPQPATMLAAPVVWLISIPAGYNAYLFFSVTMNLAAGYWFLRNCRCSFLPSLAGGIAIALHPLAIDNIERRKDTIAAHEALIQQIQGATRASESELYELISYASLPIQYIPPRSVFNDIVASGATLLIRSDELRLALAEFDQGIRWLERTDDSSWSVWESRLQPLLEGRVPRVERLRQGLRNSLRGDVPFGESLHKPDFDGVLADPRFEDMLAERWLRLQNGLNALKGVNAMAERIVGLIDVELETEKPSQ